MNLIRSNSATVLTPMQVDAAAIADRPKIRLRGSRFFYTPSPMVVTEADPIEGSTITLIYRGNTYERILQAPKPYRQPRALNWRWQ